MSHKAFVFEYDAFFNELHQILIDSLIKNNPRLLIDFIDSHRQEIRDPYEGLPLRQSWQDLIEVEDIQEYADFALTKFYDPSEDIGLGYEWEKIETILGREFAIDSNRIIFGDRIGSPENYFNPGRIGSYIQSFSRVQKNIQLIQQHLAQKYEFKQDIQDLVSMLNSAQNQHKGLYVTF